VLESEYAQREKEPTLPQEDVHIMLPWPADTLRAVSERYKSLSDKLFVLANMAGELKLRVESDEVKVETKWKGLVNPRLGMLHWLFLGADVDGVDPAAVNLAGHPSTSRPPNVFSEIKIDAKDWANLLRVSVVARSMLACMITPISRPA
jgi:HUS1 checkpoint protein